jgi:putative AlgH/UPF0301 family transcriptional regulator
LLLGAAAQAQQHLPANGVLLVAKPSLSDRNFSQTVVLVSQTEDGSTVGVIINRPTTLKLSEFLSEELPTGNYREPIFFGGPVMLKALVSVFRSEMPPSARVSRMKDVYLTMHQDNIERLLKDATALPHLPASRAGYPPIEAWRCAAGISCRRRSHGLSRKPTASGARGAGEAARPRVSR